MKRSSLERVRPLTMSDLQQVLAWRNHSEVRRYMYTQHEISLEEHIHWFQKTSTDPNRHLFIYEFDSTPLGFISLNVKSPGKIADWGFYTAPDAPKRTGQFLGRAALQYAFDGAGLYKLCGQALSYNQRSIQFHQKLGFIPEGILRQQHFDGKHYHDVVCFGLLASEWRHEE